VHIPFGLVSLEEGTMSTRQGRVVFLEDVLNRAVDQTKDIILEKLSTSVPHRFESAHSGLMVNAVLVDLDEDRNTALQIQRLRYSVEV
jgi:arginyl-tRNA synthetase